MCVCVHMDNPFCNTAPAFIHVHQVFTAGFKRFGVPPEPVVGLVVISHGCIGQLAQLLSCAQCPMTLFKQTSNIQMSLWEVNRFSLLVYIFFYLFIYFYRQYYKFRQMLSVNTMPYHPICAHPFQTLLVQRRDDHGRRRSLRRPPVSLLYPHLPGNAA